MRDLDSSPLGGGTRTRARTVVHAEHTWVVRARTDKPFKDVKDELLSAFEREYIAAALERNDMNVSATSRQTGLSRKHVRHLMRKHRLQTERRFIEE
jgi:DNA-binding NtrC family response regulator